MVIKKKQKQKQNSRKGETVVTESRSEVTGDLG